MVVNITTRNQFSCRSALSTSQRLILTFFGRAKKVNKETRPREPFAKYFWQSCKLPALSAGQTGKTENLQKYLCS